MSAARAATPFLIFTLGTQYYALAIDQVAEVAAMVELVETPGVNEVFLGVANRHGESLVMLDLRALFRQPRRAIDTTTVFIVAVVGEQQVGLVVDEVQRISYFADPPTVGRTYPDRLLAGILTYGEHLVQVIALPALLASALPETAPINLNNGQGL